MIANLTDAMCEIRRLADEVGNYRDRTGLRGDLKIQQDKIIEQMNQIGSLSAKNADAQAKEAYALGKLELTRKIEGELRAENSRQKHINTTLLKEHQRLVADNEQLKAEIKRRSDERKILSAECQVLRETLELVLDDYEGYAYNTISTKYDVPTHDPEILAKARAALVLDRQEQK